VLPCWLLPIALPHAPLASEMFGLSSHSALVSINTTDGMMTELTSEHPEELEAQELSAIDSIRQRYYSVGLNYTTGIVNLCVWSLTTGYREQQVALPFASVAFVGVGEAIAVSPVDGTIILMGHDPSRGGHHCVYTAEPESFKLTFVADVGGDMHTDLLGGSTVFDHDAEIFYAPIAFNDTTTGKPKIKYVAVNVESGEVIELDDNMLMAGCSYDSATRRVYGTTVHESATGKVIPQLHASAAPQPPSATKRRATSIADRVHTRWGASYKRLLSYFETATREKIIDVAPLPLTGAVGDVHAIDTSRRIHYTLLMGDADLKPYLPTDYCDKIGEPCASGSSCCCDSGAPPDATLGIDSPPTSCANPSGYCFAASDCSQIPPGGDPLDVAAYLVGVALDDGTLVSQAPLCSLEPSNHTVPEPCPWSIESAA